MARKQNIESRPAVSAEGTTAKHRTSRPRTPRVKPALAGDPIVAEPVEVAAGAAIEPVSDREEIARIAYSYFEARGGKHGFAEEDWLRAEQEYLRRKNGL